MDHESKIIRFGVLCRGYTFPAWQAIAIEKLLAAQDISLELIILDQNNLPNQTPHDYSFFWKMFHAFVKNTSKADQARNLSESFSKLPVIEVDNRTLNEIDLKTIKAHHLDFVLAFGFPKTKGAILGMAKHGIWSYHHDFQEFGVGPIAGFWELFEGKPVTASFLQCQLANSEKAFLLREGHLKTHYSFAKNRDHLLLESSNWLHQACVDIRYDQFDTTKKKLVPEGSAPLNTPSNWQMILFTFRTLILILKKAYKSLFITDYWNIGIAKVPIQDFLINDELPEITWFPNLPKDQFIADPFGLYQNGQLEIVYEVFPFKTGIGKIEAFSFDGSAFSKSEGIIEAPFHMSYPFVLEYNDEIYCIPETYQANQVRLYKAVDFPNSWQFEQVLIENYAGIDNTPFYHKGSWWLFSTDKGAGTHHYQLNVFYAEDLLGKWTAHPKNPVKTDIRSSRPAGTLFEHKGEVYRPSMDYSIKVEGRIVINKILILSKTDYLEEAVKIINPDSNTYFSDKIHTLSQAGPYTIVDGAKELFVFKNPYAFWYKLKSKLNKL